MSENILHTCALYSGSRGNSILVACGRDKILVDCGGSGKQTAEALRFIGVDPEELTAILVTHEHIDHRHGVGVMSRRYHLPVYATAGTWEGIGDRCGAFPDGLRRVFDPACDFYLGSLGVLPFRTSHDALEPVGFRFYAGTTSVAIATDLGYVTQDHLSLLEGTDLIFLESNHDPDLLRANEKYTERLKARILSRKGHLSNQQCADALVHLAEKGTTHFVLSHLSEENNRPQLALETSRTCAELEGMREGEDFHLDLAWQDRIGNVYEISPRRIAMLERA
ncbi:MAG: MBL fold metallo-hydrolase [Clostridia bacterium]|nr:MBL fold metallo-hydrolase [Clostridia bacterium]